MVMSFLCFVVLSLEFFSLLGFVHIDAGRLFPRPQNDEGLFHLPELKQRLRTLNPRTRYTWTTTLRSHCDSRFTVYISFFVARKVI